MCSLIPTEGRGGNNQLLICVQGGCSRAPQGLGFCLITGPTLPPFLAKLSPLCICSSNHEAESFEMLLEDTSRTGHLENRGIGKPPLHLTQVLVEKKRRR